MILSYIWSSFRSFLFSSIINNWLIRISRRIVEKNRYIKYLLTWSFFSSFDNNIFTNKCFGRCNDWTRFFNEWLALDFNFIMNDSYRCNLIINRSKICGAWSKFFIEWWALDITFNVRGPDRYFLINNRQLRNLTLSKFSIVWWTLNFTFNMSGPERWFLIYNRKLRNLTWSKFFNEWLALNFNFIMNDSHR